MYGSTFKFIKMIIFVMFTYFIFNVCLFTLYTLTKNEIFFFEFMMLFISFFALLYCYIILFIDFQNSNINKKVLRMVNNFNRVDNIFYTDSAVTHYTYLKDILKTIKQEQLDLFRNKGYVIVIGTYNELSKFTKQKGIVGLFSKTQKYILLYTDFYYKENNSLQVVNAYNFKSTFYHEWGHFLDYANRNISYTLGFQKEFNKIRNSFRDNVRFYYSGLPSLFFRKYPNFNLYELSSSSEYFASSYSKYKMNFNCGDYFRNVFDKIENKKV